MKRKAKPAPKKSTPKGRGKPPVTNRRKRNETITPARDRHFLERTPVDDPGPEDVTGFDS